MLLSLAESSIVGANQFKVKNMLRQEVSGAENLLKVMDQKSKHLSAIIFMNTIVNIGGSMLIGSLVSNVFSESYRAIFLASVTVSMLFLSEIKPKVFAASRPEQVGIRIATPLIWVTFFLNPIIYIINILVGSKHEAEMLTRCELDLMLNSANDMGVINNKESTFIHNVFSIRDRKASDLIVSECEIATIPIYENLSFAKDLATKSKFKRFITTNKRNEPVGVVFKSDILAYLLDEHSDMMIAEIVYPAVVCHKDKPMMELLDQLYRSDTHLAVIIDNNRDMLGVVTLSNIQQTILSC